ncbi:MAG: CRISPR-associated protein Cas4 [Christensenellaceae bacterium]|nr:CRISPR-associated protein Cas4 [Christensenellaceae bacterium]
MLSGIQHFAFCRRQWALIHIEELWQENLLTVQGEIMHERAHGQTVERRGDTLIVRSLPVFSKTLGFSGICDVVEFHRSEDGVPLEGKYGQKGEKYGVRPVEYKRGRPKTGHERADALQLCAQAICLEEMLCTGIEEGDLYYGETKRRVAVPFAEELREEVFALSKEMHELFARGHTPKARQRKGCESCSLKDLCLPKLFTNPSVSAYMAKALEE